MNNRPIASLSPTLLARKGAARPAMRPQLQPMRQFHESTARQLDDLGWNDMGHEAETPDYAEQAALEQQHDEEPQPSEAQQGAEIVALKPDAELTTPQVPEILRQQEEIAARMVTPRRSALADGRRAAFTLRLDGERHLKLRLACVTSSRSAQQLITEALDRLIAELPDVAELAAKVSKRR
jgi:hypothetical protein